jgi:mono/diheme cytochrome c family protein
LLAAVLAVAGCSKADAPPPAGDAPAGPAQALDGADLFDTHCSRCHGAGALGSDRGPALVDRIYEPSHHPDAAFYVAVQRGVRAHHWHFGDMPRIGGLTNAEVTAIIGYVRERQRAAGID